MLGEGLKSQIIMSFWRKSDILLFITAASLAFNNEKLVPTLSKYSWNKSPIFSNIVKFVLITLKFNINGSIEHWVLFPLKALSVMLAKTSLNNKALYVSLI